jgi:hypothetical protein
MAYTISLRLPGGAQMHFENLPRDQALFRLDYVAELIGGRISSERQSHADMIQQSVESWFTAAVSDWLSFHERPAVTIWDAPMDSLNRARSQIRRGNIREAIDILRTTTQQANDAMRRVSAYREAAITGEHSGAQRAIIGLEVTEAVLAAIAVAATAGAAGAAFAAAGTAGAAGATGATVAAGTVAATTTATAGSLLVGSATAGVTAGAYGMIMSEAGQISEHELGLRRNFDFGAVWRRGAHDAILGFVGGIVGGGLNAGLSRIATRYISANPALLMRIAASAGSNGPRLAQFIATNGAQLFSEFVSFVPTTLISTAVSNVVTRTMEDENARRQVDQDSFLHQVWLQLVQGGVMTLFVSFVVHRMTPMGAGRTGQVPTETPAPSGQLALPEPAPTSAAVEPAPSGRTSTTPVESQAAAPVSPQAAISEQTGPRAPSGPAPIPPEEVLAGPQRPPQEQAGTPATASERTTPPQEELPVEFAQTLIPTAGRRYTPLSRQQAQVVQECAVQRHLLGIFERHFRRLPAWHEFDPRHADAFIQARQHVEQTRSRVTGLESQLGDPALVERVRTHTGRNHPLTAEDYQNDFRRLTGNTGPAPDGGFITENGHVVTYREGPRITLLDIIPPESSAEAQAATAETVQVAGAGRAAPLTPEEQVAATGQIPRVAAGAQAGPSVARIMEVIRQARNLEPGTALTHEQAEAVNSFWDADVRAQLSPGERANMNQIGFTPTWEIYAGNYQLETAVGRIPPRYGFVGRNGNLSIFTPHAGQLIGPNEVLPPLPTIRPGYVRSAEEPVGGPVSPATSAESPAGLSALEQARAGGIPPTREAPLEELGGQAGGPAQAQERAIPPTRETPLEELM